MTENDNLCHFLTKNDNLCHFLTKNDNIPFLILSFIEQQSSCKVLSLPDKNHIYSHLIIREPSYNALASCDFIAIHSMHGIIQEHSCPNLFRSWRELIYSPFCPADVVYLGTSSIHRKLHTLTNNPSL